MRKLIYLTYLGLLALILISCQKETIAPDNIAVADADNARVNACRTYSYMSKKGVVQLGSVRTDYMLVGFADNVTPAQQQSLLSQYAIFDRTDGDFYMDSGPITIVMLNSSATCQSVEKMLASLEKKKQVRFAGPTFDGGAYFDWIAPGNEILVTLTDAAYYPQFRQMTRLTKTTIVTNLFGQTYIVSTNKNSAGDALQMSTVFNMLPYVANADPNFIWQLPPLRTGQKPERQTMKALPKTPVAL